MVRQAIRKVIWVMGRYFLSPPISFMYVAVNGMDDRAGAEEEQSLEHGVGEQVEHGSHETQAFLPAVSRNPEGQHHVADLRHGGKGQDALDIELGTGDDRGKKRCESADIGNDFQGRQALPAHRPGIAVPPGKHRPQPWLRRG